MNNTTSKEIASKIQKLRKEFMTAARAEFQEAAQKLFEKYDRLKSFGFTAYKPYFNDGDECTYGVSGDYPEINGYGDNGYDDENGVGENLLGLAMPKIYKDKQYIDNPNFDTEAKTIEKAVKDFINSFEDETIEAMFGDHKKITVTNSKIKVEEFEHD